MFDRRKTKIYRGHRVVEGDFGTISKRLVGNAVWNGLKLEGKWAERVLVIRP